MYVGELSGGELCGGELNDREDLYGDLCVVGVVCVGSWWGELCGGVHSSHQMDQAYTHHCLHYPQQ